MFKKPRRHFRKRQDNSEEDEAGEIPYSVSPLAIQSSNGVTKTADKSKKTKKDKTASANPISFHNDGEEETAEEFKVKKSSASRKLIRQLKKEQKREKEEERFDKDPKGTSIVLNGESAADMELDSDAEEQKDDAQHHQFKSVLERGSIPDANLIHVARKMRAKAREGGDFIPLDDTKTYDTPPSSTRRLVREDDNDASDDEGRIGFTGVTTGEEDRRNIQERFLATEHGSDEDQSGEEEVMSEWERQQIRKVVGRVGADLLPAAQSELPEENYYTFSHSFEHPYANAAGMDLATKPLPDSISIDQIKKEIKDKLNNMQQVHRVHTLELENVTTGLQQSRLSEAELADRSSDSQISRLNAKYTFYQQTRSYIRDVLECFNDKYETIGELDVRLMKMLKINSEKLMKRRKEDVKDETSDCSFINKLAIPPPADPKSAAAKHRRVADRDARRLRRRRQRADSGKQQEHHEGLSSDDERSNSDVIMLDKQRVKLFGEARAVLDDVRDEFRSVSHLLETFTRWRERYRDEYSDAYISLCLPKLLLPLVKLALIEWNPLSNDTTSWKSLWSSNSMSWYRPVVLYSMGCPSDDPDHELLPNIVEKVLVPKITGYIYDVWDPMSTSQTHHLAQSLLEYVEIFPTLNWGSKNLQVLARAIEEKITKSLEDDTFMPLYSTDLLTKNADSRSFLHRQIWTMIKLYRNILAFLDFLSDLKLLHLSMDCLLNRYIMLGLQCASHLTALPRVSALLEPLPSRWLRPSRSDKPIPELQALVRYVQSCISQLHEACGTPLDAERRKYRDEMKEYLQILMDVNAMDEAKKVSEEFSLRMPKR